MVASQEGSCFGLMMVPALRPIKEDEKLEQLMHSKMEFGPQMEPERFVTVCLASPQIAGPTTTHSMPTMLPSPPNVAMAEHATE